MTVEEIRAIVAQVSFQDWTFVVERDGAGSYLQVVFDAPDLGSGRIESWTGRKWRLSAHMTKSEIVTTALKAVLTAVEHEAREAFKFQGRAIFGPHIDVEALVALVDQSRPDARAATAGGH